VDRPGNWTVAHFGVAAVSLFRHYGRMKVVICYEFEYNLDDVFRGEWLMEYPAGTPGLTAVAMAGGQAALVAKEASRLSGERGIFRILHAEIE
jgi:hypothetical protein